MSEFLILKNIQLGQNSFGVESIYSTLNFSFYCASGIKKHFVNLSLADSFFLKDLIEAGKISNTALAKSGVDKLENLENTGRLFPYQYQMFCFDDCDNQYLIIFSVIDYRDTYSFIIYGVLQLRVPV
ncbi:hypothetical protein [Flavobacterium reichenbachii]|uniref:Uncharacterized protein n=1 Tax=Flavobacterium reichenbachii TaxID=362418 RepID=A0A085ZF24_9FLAO|nr:hypothetical protein [Flavobacterium reichenbachii]KFF03038.1 hypothetical protein IW19_23185 [Flavobacterium reichenbachii]OXB17184.1 hypothetical protein B0A68_05150 [Flavobacterium reichenbachii]